MDGREENSGVASLFQVWASGQRMASPANAFIHLCIHSLIYPTPTHTHPGTHIAHLFAKSWEPGTGNTTTEQCRPEMSVPTEPTC